MPLSKFTRVAVEGDTIDGREITRQQVKEMAETYDRKVYGARVFTEHFRGLLPGGPFDALGDVVELKAEEIKEGSDLDGKLGLYAKVDALPSLVKLNQDKQKIYHSIEMATNFANSGKPYMVGLAVTDTPASQGTQMLAFGSGAGDVIAGKDHEGKLEFISDEGKDDTGEGKPSLFSRVKEMLGKTKGESDERFSELEKAIEEIATFAQALDKKVGDGNQGETVSKTDFDALKSESERLSADLKALRDQLNLTQSPDHQERSEATGGTGEAVTDC